MEAALVCARLSEASGKKNAPHFGKDFFKSITKMYNNLRYVLMHLSINKDLTYAQRDVFK